MHFWIICFRRTAMHFVLLPVLTTQLKWIFYRNSMTWRIVTDNSDKLDKLPLIKRIRRLCFALFYFPCFNREKLISFIDGASKEGDGKNGYLVFRFTCTATVLELHIIIVYCLSNYLARKKAARSQTRMSISLNANQINMCVCVCVELAKEH